MFKKNFSGKKFRFVILIIFLFFCFLLGKIFKFDFEPARNFFGSFPLALSGVIFIFLYVISTTLILVGPKDILRVLSAVLFGPFISTFFVYIGELFNAAILFSISRKLGRDYVKDKFKISDEEIKERKEKGFIGTLALRINPLIPERIIDLGAGLSKLSFQKYFFVCLIGTPIRTYWTQSIISAVGESILYDPKVVMSYLMNNPKKILFSFFYLFFVFIFSVFTVILKLIRKNKAIPHRSLSLKPNLPGADQDSL